MNGLQFGKFDVSKRFADVTAQQIAVVFERVFGFAGLWEEWLDKETGELLETCTIITTEANEVLEPVHDRMPVILKAKDYEQWLDEKEKDTDKLQKLLVPYPSKEMASHAVSRAVNIPAANMPELIEELNSK